MTTTAAPLQTLSPAVEAARERVIDLHQHFTEQMGAVVDLYVTQFARASASGMPDALVLGHLKRIEDTLERFLGAIAPAMAQLREFNRVYGS